MLLQLVKILYYVLIIYSCKVCPVKGQENASESTPTPASNQVTTFSSVTPLNNLTTEISAKSNISQTSNTSVQSFTKPASILLPLAGDIIKLNVSAKEMLLEFILTIKYNPAAQQAGAQDGDVSFVDAKRLLIGFDNGGSTTDIVSLPFATESEGKLTFSGQIQDLSWNKKNGVLLTDPDQNYKLVAFGAEKNGSQFFIQFNRPWLTCDLLDMQFGLSSWNLWWLIDTLETWPVSKQTNTTLETLKMFEKQELATTQSTGETTNGAGTLETPMLASSQSPPTTDVLPKSSSTGGSNTSSNVTKGIDKAKFNKVNDVDVEILKSIDQYNFKGPLNVSMKVLLENTTMTILKDCEISDVIVHCNVSNHKELEILSSNGTKIPWIWRVNLNPLPLVEKFSEYRLQPCLSVLEMSKFQNKKFYNALSGKRNHNLHSGKNSVPQLRVINTLLVYSCILQQAGIR